MAATISLEGLIALIGVICVTCPGFILSRQWIMRKRPITAASIITDGAVLLFGCFLLTAAGLIMTDAIIERDLRKTYKEDTEVLARLLTKPYLVRFFMAGVCYSTELWLLKVAFLGYFSNLRQHFTQRARKVYFAVCVYTGVTYVIVMGFQIGYCQPVSLNWELDPTKQCLTLKTMTVSTLQAMLNLSADLLVLGVALHVISSLKLGRRERFALFFVAAIGSVAIVMCIIRFVQVYEIIVNPAMGTMDVMRQLYVWGTLETNFAIAAFCLPAYRVFFTNWFRRGYDISRKMTAGTAMSSRGYGKGTHNDVRSQKGRIRVDDTVEIEYEHSSQTELSSVRPEWDPIGTQASRRDDRV